MHLPVVTRFLSPPDIPLIISSPTMVSAQTSSPKTYIFMLKIIQTGDISYLRKIYNWFIELFIITIPSDNNQ